MTRSLKIGWVCNLLPLPASLPLVTQLPLQNSRVEMGNSALSRLCELTAHQTTDVEEFRELFDCPSCSDWGTSGTAEQNPLSALLAGACPWSSSHYIILLVLTSREQTSPRVSYESSHSRRDFGCRERFRSVCVELQFARCFTRERVPYVVPLGWMKCLHQFDLGRCLSLLKFSHETYWSILLRSSLDCLRTALFTLTLFLHLFHVSA
jgi:hypothetical protein